MTSKIKIIAEVGVNHNGDIDIAKKLAYSAFESGADIVKFQSFIPQELVIPTAQTANYQNVNTNENYQIRLLESLKLSDDDQAEIHKYCHDIGIEFLSTGFEKHSIQKLINLGIQRIKIPSGEITNIPFLEYIASQKLPIIISTGMSTLDEIKRALDVLEKNGADTTPITVLHCTSNYPATDEELNLRAMITIAKTFNSAIGYSDHSIGKEAAIAAAALGATIIEKHITLDCSMTGPDHKASMEIDDFKDFIKSIRRVELALGSFLKEPSNSERATMAAVRKSIVSSGHIKAGSVFDVHNVTTKRPGIGIPASQWYSLLGKKSKRDYSQNELIDKHEI